MFDFNKNKKNSGDLYNSILRSLRVWQLIAVILLVINLILLSSFILLANKQRIIPWVVQVDEHGFEVAIAPAEQVSTVDNRIIISRIGRFIECLRTVVADREAQKALVDWVYVSIPETSAAQAYTTQFYRTNEPTKRAKEGTVSVEVKSIIPISANTYRAEWIEKTIKAGEIAYVDSWTGIFSIAVSSTRDIKSVIKNPLGVYITDYTVTGNFN